MQEITSIISIVKTFIKYNFVLVAFVLLSVNGWGQTTVFTDDFNRATLSPGGTPSMTYSSTLATNITSAIVSSTYLSIGSAGTAPLSGISYTTGSNSSFSSPFSTTLSSNLGLVTWTFNFRWNRASTNNPAVPASGSYGTAIVLGGTSLTLTSGNGYAIIYGSSNTPDPIRLCAYTNGVTGTLNNICSSGANDIANTNNYASVRVTYDPSTNNWSLFVRDDGTSGWSDPSTGVTTQKGSTTANSTYTSSNLTAFGFLWSHNNGTNTSSDFDNFKVTVLNPSITGAATATAFTTTYGTASAAQSFSISGSNLTANLIATAPTGFEVSSDGTTYGTTATFTQTGGSASGTLRIRLSATAASGNYNSQNIVLSSTGATSVNITTASTGNTVTAIVPNAPSINNITTSNSQLSVAFTAPSSNGGANITNYEYSTDNGSTWVTPSPSVTSSPFTISGLSNGTTYNIKIRAVNSVGSGTASSTVQGIPASIWWVGTTGNWSTANNWNSNAIPSSTDYILISSGNPTLDVDYEIPTGYNLTLSSSGTLTINPGKKLIITGSADFGGKSVTVKSDNTGSGAIVLNNSSTLLNASNVTLQQYFNAQRAWRVLSNPFNSSLTPSTISSSNGSNTGSSAISVNQNSANDIVQYNSGNDQWSLSTSISSNTCYAFFYKGLLGDFNGTPSLNNYGVGGGPSATVYSVKGTLNNSDVNFTPTNASPNFTLVGNPFAAPINSQALTENSSLPYYYYNPISGSTAPNIKSGAWLAASSNSSTSTTIPMMGVIAYQATSTGTFTISKNSINTTPVYLNNNLFKTTSGIKNLEINLVRNSNLHDRLIIRENETSMVNSIDEMDLNKMENPISNIYSITNNNQHLAVNTEYNFNKPIPIGIDAPIGQYQIKVGSNTFSNTDMILIDHYLNQQQVLHNGASYNFEITTDSNTKGEHRFEIVKQTWTTNINTQPISKNVKILNNLVNDRITLFIEGQFKHYLITDTKGSSVEEGILHEGENNINIQSIAQGLYFLHIKDQNQLVYKIIKQ